MALICTNTPGPAYSSGTRFIGHRERCSPSRCRTCDAHRTRDPSILTHARARALARAGSRRACATSAPATPATASSSPAWTTPAPPPERPHTSPPPPPSSPADHLPARSPARLGPTPGRCAAARPDSPGISRLGSFFLGCRCCHVSTATGGGVCVCVCVCVCLCVCVCVCVCVRVGDGPRRPVCRSDGAGS